MKDGYPEGHELQTIKDWDVLKDPFGLMDFIETITWTSDWCIKRRGKKIIYFDFHTAGWSGNEDIIQALSGTDFWHLYWNKTYRGGHYYFRVYKLKSNRK